MNSKTAMRDLHKLTVLLELASRGLGEHEEPEVASVGFLHLAQLCHETQVELGETLDAMTPEPPRMVPRDCG